MQVERLEQELREYLGTEAREVEPPIEWWNTIVSGLEDRKNTSSWKRFVPKTRLAWALATLVLLVIVVVLILVDFIAWYLTDPSGTVSTKVVPQPGDEMYMTSAILIHRNLDELIESSDAIAIGRVKEILPPKWGTFSLREQVKLIYTDVLIEVDKFLYGEPESETISVRVMEGRIGNQATVAEHGAEFTLGEEVFLFLHRIKDPFITPSPEGINPANYYMASIQDKYGYWHGVIDNRDDDRFPMCTWFVQMRIATIRNK